MAMDAVIGCEGVDAGPEWLRLRTAAGAVRTIPWSAIQLAGMGGNHEGGVTISGVTEKVAPYFPTHDSLWIIYGDGMVQAMIDKAGAKRDAIIGTFARQLGSRWHGDQLAPMELSRALMGRRWRRHRAP